MKIAMSREMREIDKTTMEWFGLPGVVLMENAGRAVADKAIEMLGEPRGKIVFIVCGRGNTAVTAMWRRAGFTTAERGSNCSWRWIARWSRAMR